MEKRSSYEVIRELIGKYGVRFIVNASETDLRVLDDELEFRILRAPGGYTSITPETDVDFDPEAGEFVWRESDCEGEEVFYAKPYLLLDKELASAFGELAKANEEAEEELKETKRLKEGKGENSGDGFFAWLRNDN